MADQLTIETVELESTLRPMGENGAPSSSDYNDSMREVLMDLATLSEVLNSQIIPMLNAVKAQAGEPLPDSIPGTPIVGLQGSTIFTDTSDLSPVFFDAKSNSPLAVADSMRIISRQTSSVQMLVNDLAVQVQSLRTALAISGQNDIASAISNMYALIEQMQSQISSLNQSSGVNTQGLRNIQSQTIAINSIYPGAVDSIPVLWGSPFADNTYAVSYALNDDSGSLVIQSYSYLANGTGVTIRVKNISTDTQASGVVSVMAREVS